ncbi:hypothetical protein CCACVL1_25024 [Corchorus capsularis]|uniref:Uncharacterized protein n=1 Tax=Corchorus capsularis TaxID=210143 RepID=A0A1R3GM93_COCAP|nr:hypothetical protein CCACVL1_25024 [Corchorus capsularis]
MKALKGLDFQLAAWHPANSASLAQVRDGRFIRGFLSISEKKGMESSVESKGSQG